MCLVAVVWGQCSASTSQRRRANLAYRVRSRATTRCRSVWCSVCCSVLQRVEACCSVLQYVAVCGSMLHCGALRAHAHCNIMHHTATHLAYRAGYRATTRQWMPTSISSARPATHLHSTRHRGARMCLLQRVRREVAVVGRGRGVCLLVSP